MTGENTVADVGADKESNNEANASDGEKPWSCRKWSSGSEGNHEEPESAIGLQNNPPRKHSKTLTVEVDVVNGRVGLSVERNLPVDDVVVDEHTDDTTNGPGGEDDTVGSTDVLGSEHVSKESGNDTESSTVAGRSQQDRKEEGPVHKLFEDAGQEAENDGLGTESDQEDSLASNLVRDNREEHTTAKVKDRVDGVDGGGFRSRLAELRLDHVLELGDGGKTEHKVAELRYKKVSCGLKGSQSGAKGQRGQLTNMTYMRRYSSEVAASIRSIFWRISMGERALASTLMSPAAASMSALASAAGAAATSTVSLAGAATVAAASTSVLVVSSLGDSTAATASAAAA